MTFPLCPGPRLRRASAPACKEIGPLPSKLAHPVPNLDGARAGCSLERMSSEIPGVVSNDAHSRAQSTNQEIRATAPLLVLSIAAWFGLAAVRLNLPWGNLKR